MTYLNNVRRKGHRPPFTPKDPDNKDQSMFKRGHTAGIISVLSLRIPILVKHYLDKDLCDMPLPILGIKRNASPIRSIISRLEVDREYEMVNPDKLDTRGVNISLDVLSYLNQQIYLPREALLEKIEDPCYLAI